MCTLLPIVPVDEIIERLKALEGGMRENDSSRPVPREIRPATPAAPSAPRPPEKKVTRPASAPAAPVGEGWAGFVAFVHGEKKRLGAILDHGRPLRFTAECVEIGFPAGSFHLTCLQDVDALESLKNLAARFWKSEPLIRLTPLNGEPRGLPATVQEKRSIEAAGRRQELEESARGNPVVAAALEIFNGEIGEIAEIANDEDMEDTD
jgi:DNA polymerase-3 subunit gamma/tau